MLFRSAGMGAIAFACLLGYAKDLHAKQLAADLRAKKFVGVAEKALTIVSKKALTIVNKEFDKLYMHKIYIIEQLRGVGDDMTTVVTAVPLMIKDVTGKAAIVAIRLTDVASETSTSLVENAGYIAFGVVFAAVLCGVILLIVQVRKEYLAKEAGEKYRSRYTRGQGSSLRPATFNGYYPK